MCDGPEKQNAQQSVPEKDDLWNLVVTLPIKFLLDFVRCRLATKSCYQDIPVLFCMNRPSKID